MATADRLSLRLCSSYHWVIRAQRPRKNRKPMLDTVPFLLQSGFPSIRRGRLQAVQVNLGYRCNQSCLHCHVAAGPKRSEQMQPETIEQVLEFVHRQGVATLDLTGGAPELNPNFRDLVMRARRFGVHVMDRCNLTILEEPGYEDLADFLAAQQVEVVASLPCYLEENVDAQRGKGVFEKSIRALRRLNGLGYGDRQSGLGLSLVYNPPGPSLPPSQPELEADYRKHLGERYGIAFTRLLCIANMPIQRFGSTLLSKGQLAGYLDLLRTAHQEENLEAVMCRSLVSIDWRGYLFDCDFNQMLGIGLGGDRGTNLRHISSVLQEELSGRAIGVAGHCFGCTAGQGSGCGGALG